MTLIDAAWRGAHPLPDIGKGQDKDDRGKVLVVGGSRLVPGAGLLTGEAALRAGAGKVQIGTIDQAAMSIGIALPESAVIGLPMDDAGEIALAAGDILGEYASKCQALVVGPGISTRPTTCDFVKRLMSCLDIDTPLLLDAGAMTAFRNRGDELRHCILTPHAGELATLAGRTKADILGDPPAAATDAARALGVIVVLKSAETFIADPGGAVLHFVSDAPGLGTAGSGDVLAGLITGLLARRVDPLVAAGWGVYLHGEAGRLAGQAIGPIGYVARDLFRFIPQAMSHTNFCADGR